MNVILIDAKLSERSTERVTRYAAEKGLEYFVVDMDNILPGKTSKAIGIIDINLADAIKNELKES